MRPERVEVPVLERAATHRAKVERQRPVAEEYLEARNAFRAVRRSECHVEDLVTLARVRHDVSLAAGRPMIARLDRSAEASGFAGHEQVASIAARGPVTPDHIIRTKRVPLIVDDDPTGAVRGFADAYGDYFRRHTDGRLTMIDSAPRWAVWRGRGLIAFGPTVADGNVVHDIAEHTAAVIQRSEALGGWCPARGGRPLRRRVLGARAGEAPKARRGSIARRSRRVRDGLGERNRTRAVARELTRQGAVVVGADIRDLARDDDVRPGKHLLAT